MATRKVSTEFGVKGEQEYKKAISDINSGLGVLKSEMKKVSSEFLDNEKSVEALSKKNEVLERTQSSQREKVEALRKALEECAKAHGEADSRTMKWQRQLNEAEAELNQTTHAIDENKKAIAEQTEQTEKSKLSFDDLVGTLKDSLPAGARSALDAFEKFSGGSITAFAAIAVAVKEVVDITKELIETTKQAARDVDDLVTASTKSGIDTYTLQVLNYMEELADVDVSTVESSVAKLTKTMSDARDGTASAVEAFAQLGVEFQNADGTLRDADEVLWDVVDSLGAMEDGSERDALAMEVFGKKAQELNTLIALGSDGFKSFAQEAENAGYILSEKDLKTLNDYNDALDRANKQQEAMSKQLAVEMAPALQELTEGWSNLKTEGLQLIIDSGIIDFLADLISAIGQVIGFVGDMIEVFNALMHPVQTIKELLGFQNETLEDTAKVTTVATEANESFKASVSSDAQALNNTANAANNAANSLRQYAIAAGYSANISDRRLAELGSYSQASATRGAGFFGDYAGYTADEFRTLLQQNNITNASQISAVLGEGAYNFYKASAYYNAAGDQNFKGGLTWVGESGPELVSLPQGSRIYSNQESRSMGDTFNITIDARSVKEFEDIIRVAKNARMMARKEG